MRSLYFPLFPASIGTALYPDQGENPEQLIRHADQSMYHAKPH
ncbi:MAG: diguanylate cyclase [Pseudomonadales bacterium]|nr:diguanylate cyclase [Pseudomonadales bacterium]